MIRDLSRMYSSLEEQVREKTADLNRQNKALNLLYGLKNVLSAELNRSVLEKALDFCSENLEALSCAVYLRNDGDKTLRLAARFSQHPIDPEEIRKFFEGQNISFEKYNFFKREVLGKDCTLVLVPGAVGTTRLSFAAIFCGEAPVHIDRELLRSIAREFALAINNSEKNVESRRLILLKNVRRSPVNFMTRSHSPYLSHEFKSRVWTPRLKTSPMKLKSAASSMSSSSV